MYCSYCGRKIKDDSRYCSYCGRCLIGAGTPSWPSWLKRPNWNIAKTKDDVKQWLKSSFFRLYALWCFIQCILWYNAQSAYSDYFNNTRLRDWYNHDIPNNYIYPDHWLYPIRNLISGIAGQDPVYVYDGTEFFVYVVVIPALLTAIVQNSLKWFGIKTESAVEEMKQVVRYVTRWMCIVFSAGLLGLDFIGTTFIFGVVFFTLYGYDKLKTKNRRHPQK